MQVTNLTYSISNQKYTPAFQSRACTKTLQTAQNCTLGSLRDGCIGKIAVTKANGVKEFLSVEKHTNNANLETYYFKNDREQLVGEMVLAINKYIRPFLLKNFCTDHVYISSLKNFSSPRVANFDKSIEEYKGIGTKFLQIALKKSEEENCNGNIELYSSGDAKTFYKENGFNEEFIIEGNVCKMYLPSERKEFLRQKNGGVELILPDNRVWAF